MAVQVSIVPFSYMRGIPEDRTGHGGRFPFDCRGRQNPFWEEGVRKFSGRDVEVVAFFGWRREAVETFAGAAEVLARQTVRPQQD